MPAKKPPKVWRCVAAFDAPDGRYEPGDPVPEKLVKAYPTLLERGLVEQVEE